MESLKRYSLKELKKLRKIVSQYGSMEELKNDLNTIISIREETQKTGLNVQFNMEWWIKYHVFNSWEIEILKRNDITNLQELIDCDLDQLDGMTQGAKEIFEWARKFYDFRPVEERKGHSKK